MNANEDILELTKRYFTQQSEIYGTDIYIELATKSASALDSGAGLPQLAEQAGACTACQLARTRTNVVFGVGNPQAKLMCIGEAPGYDEDQKGEPFVGKAGQLLNKILAAIGFGREEVYIANVLKCRPPNNRDPEPDEREQCLPFLHRQIELVNPVLILMLGRVAAQSLLNIDAPLSKLREQTHEWQGRKVVVTYHPAALLRNQQWRRSTWEDVQKLRKMYDEIVGDKEPMKVKKK